MIHRAAIRSLRMAVACLAVPVSQALAGPCILPVTGEEPMSEVETRQPYRLATNPITLPGYQGLLLRPLNRPSKDHAFQILGTRYEPVPAPAPGSNIFDKDLIQTASGDRFLAGWDNRILWHLPAGSQQWQQVRPGARWWGTAYDDGSEEFYVGFGAKEPLLRWDGTAFVPAGPMPTIFPGETSTHTENGLPIAILTLPGAGGTFAVAVDWFNEKRRSLWFRPTAGDWTLVATQPDLDRLAPGLIFPGPFGDADVSADGTTVRLFAGTQHEATVLLRKGVGGWRLDSAAPIQNWVTHDPSGIRLGWIGQPRQDLTERYLLFFDRPVDPVPPVLHALDPGTLASRPLPGPAPVGEVTGNSIFYLGSIWQIPGVEPLLIRAADGWYTFNGAVLAPLPALAAVGRHPRVRRLGPLVLIQSSTGLLVLDETLTARRVDSFPHPEPDGSVMIDHIEASGLFVVTRSTSDTVHISTDFRRFDALAAPSAVTKVVAALPDRPALLLVGEDGLYTLEAECPSQRG